MKVMVTGASGFLGRYVVASLLNSGFNVVAVSREKSGHIDDVEYIPFDLLDPGGHHELIRSAGATHLIHLAWYAEHGKYWSSSLNLDWVQATARLAQAFCEVGGQHIIAAGTCAEYDWSEGYCRETMTPVRPDSVYGTAKATTHRLLEALAESFSVRCAWARIFFPFGAGENRERLVSALIDALRGTRAPFGVNGACSRDFLHASDVAEGLKALLAARAHGAFNISAAEPVQIRELVEMLARQLHASPDPILELPSSRVNEAMLVVGDNARLRSLGWKPQLSMSEGLLRTIQEIDGAGTPPSGRRTDDKLPSL
jgi:nucleoside-diphosphate-sugar epimerase